MKTNEKPKDKVDAKSKDKVDAKPKEKVDEHATAGRQTLRRKDPIFEIPETVKRLEACLNEKPKATNKKLKNHQNPIDMNTSQGERGLGRVLGMLQKAKDMPMGAVAQPASTWRQVSIVIDSGACDNVINPEDVPEHEVKESIESKRGENFFSATGEPIPNLGDIQLPMFTREGTQRGMKFKGAPVAKPLGAVKKICSAGHFVGFSNECSFILNLTTGEMNWLREDDGNYLLDVWVPPSNNSADNAESGFGGRA